MKHTKTNTRKEYSRGREEQSTTMADGFKITVTHCLKNGIGQMYGYCIQLPCKGWVMFDIRSFVDDVPKEFILTPDSLPYVVELIRYKNTIEMKNISWPLF